LKIKGLLSVFFIAFSLSLFAQEQEKIRVLLVPFERFDFQSPFSFSDIANYNNFSSQAEVFPKYQAAVVQQLSAQHPQVEVYTLPEPDIQQIRIQSPKVYKYQPIDHQGIDLSRLVEQGRLAQLLESFAADYIVFLTWYEISAKLLSTKSSFQGSKLLAWSVHKITYEAYNGKGELVALVDKMPLEPKLPKEQFAHTKGTMLSDIQDAYLKVQDDLSKKLMLYQRKKRPIYKIK